MDEVAEVSDELMERYLEGEEISHEETVSALKTGRHRGPHLPGHLRRGHAQPRHQPPARRVRRGPALARQEGRRSSSTATDARARRVEGHGRLRLQDARRPVRRPHQPLPRLPGRGQARQPGAQLPRAREGAHRPAARAAGQGAPSTPTSSAPATSARWPSSRRPTPATCSPRRTPTSRCRMPAMPKPVMAFAIEAKAKGDEEKIGTALRRLQEEDPTIDFHRDHADRRADRRGADADPRRGDRGSA